MRKKIKMLLFDIDGVITDGKKYIDGKEIELKSIAIKDLDAFRMLKDAGYKIGCVTGENTSFSRQFADMQIMDYVKIGCKQKDMVLDEIGKKCKIVAEEICYIGDGKYDIPILEKIGLAICPYDAIEEVKNVSDIVLKRRGGEGCIAEIYTLLCKLSDCQIAEDDRKSNLTSILSEQMAEHRCILDLLMTDSTCTDHFANAINMILESYRRKGCLFLCGNGGSAADAQHLAAELVGRFYLERRALRAEALTVNTSILTSLANDYDYNMIFARQLEAKAIEGDVLLGITTSGTSENVVQAFKKAKIMNIKTILLTGAISDVAPILAYTDCALAVPSSNTPRIQEMHILIGHIICEVIEREIGKIYCVGE